MVTVRNINLHQWVFIVVIILPKCKQKRNENSGGILLHNARKLHLISSSYSYAHSDVIHLGGKFHQGFVSICIGEDLPWKDQYVFSITEWFSEWFEVVNKADVWAYAWNPLIFCDLETCQANNSRYFRILANIYIYNYSICASSGAPKDGFVCRGHHQIASPLICSLELPNTKKNGRKNDISFRIS